MDRRAPSKWILRLLGLMLLMCLALAWRGPAWLTALQPRSYYEGRFLADFFQEWASARNYYGGLPIYTPQEVTLSLYFREQKAPNDLIFNEVNAHPPSSVLLALPFAKLDYADAFLLWNELSLILLGASIWLVLRNLRIDISPQVGLAILTLLLLCNPLLSQVQQGQLTAVVVFLLTLCWTFERSDRPWLAGLSLGIATALKLFPGFLFLPFVLRRRWRVVLAGVASLVGLSALTLAVLGFDTYLAYACDVLPTIAKYRGACHNLSLCGIWYKLLVPLPHWMPVTFAPATPQPLAAACGYLLVAGLVTFVTSKIVLRAPQDVDLWFSASTVAMLLVSPVTWDHYLLLLLLPVPVLWQRLPRSGLAWPPFLFFVGLLCIEPFLVMEHGLILVGAASAPQPGRWLATPLETLTALSVPCYALVGLFMLAFLSARNAGHDGIVPH